MPAVRAFAIYSPVFLAVAPARRCVVTALTGTRDARKPNYYCQQLHCTGFCGVGVIDPGARNNMRQEGDNIEVTGFVRDATGLTYIHACKVEKTTGTQAITAVTPATGTENFGSCSTCPVAWAPASLQPESLPPHQRGCTVHASVAT